MATLRFSSPVDPSTSDVLSKGWVDATGFAKRYRIGTSAEAYHTGCDLNLNTPRWDSDAHHPVYAIGDGTVTAARSYAGWGNLIVIDHGRLPDGRPVFARYAHVVNMRVKAGDRVHPGQQIAQVGDGGGLYAYHLHFDVSLTEQLKNYPADWPKMDLTRLKRDYVDPVQFFASITATNETINPDPMPVPAQPEPLRTMYVKTDGANLNIRAAATILSSVIGKLPNGKQIRVTGKELADTSSANRFLKLADQDGYVAASLLSYTAPTAMPSSFRLPFTAKDRGLHMSAGGWSPSALEIDLVRRNQIKTALIVAYEYGQAASAIQRLRDAGVQHFIIRAALHGEYQHVKTAAEFSRYTLPILKEYAAALGVTKGMMIAVHNEPNLFKEGYAHRWKTGAEFAAWYRQVVEVYRRELPGCAIGFPALSPGGAVANIRADEESFLLSAKAAGAFALSDWFGVHYYWAHPANPMTPPAGKWSAWFGVAKPIVCTEGGPGDLTYTTADAIRRLYAKLAEHYIPNMAWLSSGAGAWQNAAWDRHNVTL